MTLRLLGCEALILASALLLTGGMYLLPMVLTDWTGQEAPFSDEVRVTKTDMLFAESQGGTAVIAIGKLMNPTEGPVGIQGVRVVFRDENGGRVDACGSRCVRTIPPQAEVAFRASTLATAPVEQYRSCQVTVK